MTRNKRLDTTIRCFLLSLGLLLSLAVSASGMHAGEHKTDAKTDCARQNDHKHADKQGKTHHHDCKEKAAKKSDDGHDHSH